MLEEALSNNQKTPAAEGKGYEMRRKGCILSPLTQGLLFPEQNYHSQGMLFYVILSKDVVSFNSFWLLNVSDVEDQI